MARYTIAGFRAGEKITTSAGTVELHVIDGAAELSTEQKAYFESHGYDVTKASDVPPAGVPVPQGPHDAEVAESLRRAEEQATAARRVPTAPVTTAKTK